MHLSSLIRDKLVFLHEPVASGDAAIRFLAERVAAENLHGLHPDQIYEKICERENLGSTVYENGLAIPHARIEQFGDVVIAVLTPAEPVDGIRIMFLILTDIARSNLYLNVLAALAGIGRSGETLERLLAVKSAKEFVQELASMEFVVKKTVTVSDLMSTPPKFLGPDATVKDALDFMSQQHVGYIPICTEAGELLGEVTIADILTAGIPQYARMLTNLKFLSALEPFEELLENEAITPLRTIMIRPPLTLSPQAIVYEAVFQFLNHNRRHYSVVQDGICVGVLSTVDLINKFLRA